MMMVIEWIKTWIKEKGRRQKEIEELKRCLAAGGGGRGGRYWVREKFRILF